MNSPSRELKATDIRDLAKEAGFTIGPGWHVFTIEKPEKGTLYGALEKFAQLLLQREGEADPVAWFAFADSNGPIPLELWGVDEKACKYAVLMNARSIGWKGTVEGYLLHAGWTIRPVYDRAQQPTAPGGKDDAYGALTDNLVLPDSVSKWEGV